MAGVCFITMEQYWLLGVLFHRAVAGVGIMAMEQYWLLGVLYWRMMAGVCFITR